MGSDSSSKKIKTSKTASPDAAKTWQALATATGGDPCSLLGNPLAGWVRGLVDRDLADTLKQPPDDSAEWDAWDAEARADDESEAKIRAAHARAVKSAAKDRASTFFISLGDPVDFGDGPAWTEEKIAGPDFAALLAGEPVTWRGRGKPKHVYTGLEVQLLTAWRIASCALRGVKDETGVLTLDRCRRTAHIARHTSYAPIDQYDPTAAVAAWLAPVIVSGRMTLEALLKLGVCKEIVNTLRWACRTPGDTDLSWVRKVVRDQAALALVRAQLIDLADPAQLSHLVPDRLDVLTSTVAYIDRISDMLDDLDPNSISPKETRPAIVFDGDTPGLLTDKNGPASRAEIEEAERSGAVWLGVREDDPDDDMGWLMPEQLAAIQELADRGCQFYFDDWGDTQAHQALAPHLPVQPTTLETQNVLGIVYPGLNLGCPHRHVFTLSTNPTLPDRSRDNLHDIRIHYPDGITDQDVSRIMEIMLTPVQSPSPELPADFWEEEPAERKDQM